MFLCAYGAGRRIGEGAISDDDSSDPTTSLFSDNAPFINAEEWLMQLDYAESKDTSKNKMGSGKFDQIKRLLIDLLPDVSDIRITVDKSPRYKAKVEFDTLDGWVSIDDISFGYRTLSAWMIDFASRLFEKFPKSKNPLAEPAVCLVDEIDLHLHPKWQRDIISYLTERFPATQFIFTAHSPLIVQAAADANLAVLRREGDHVVIDQSPTGIVGWRIDQIITSDLFGIASARGPQFDALVQEREGLLSKSRLTKKNRARIEDIKKNHQHHAGR
jgi:predicted ATP-binding protein involved in virulence